MPKKRLTGRVTSTKMDKTVVVSIETAKRHKVYQKLIRTVKKFKARDNINVELGDLVVIEECAPFSKTVTWKVVSKLDREVK